MINVVCAVLENSEREFLVCKRPAGKPLAGLWEFPGGKIELGETDQQALRREISEELGCEVRVEKALPTVEHHYPEFSIRLVPFLCQVEAGVPQALDHEAIKWLAAEDFHTLDWAEADVPVWQQLISERS